ncbi:hypothetical protein ABPG74_006218 [Tetrahymena malaccensis]
MDMKNLNIESKNKKLIINLPQQQIVIDQNGVQCNSLKKQQEEQQQTHQIYQNNTQDSQSHNCQVANNFYQKQTNNNFQSNTNQRNNTIQVSNLACSQKQAVASQNFIQKDPILNQLSKQQNGQFQKVDCNHNQKSENKNQLIIQNSQVRSKDYIQQCEQNQQEIIQSIHNDEEELFKKSSNPIFSRSLNIQQKNIIQKKDSITHQNVNKTIKNHINTHKLVEKQQQIFQHQQKQDQLQQSCQKTSKSEILQLARGIVQKALIQQNEIKENPKQTQIKMNQQEINNLCQYKELQKEKLGFKKQLFDDNKQIYKENICETSYQKQNQNIQSLSQFQNQQCQWSDDQEESKYIEFPNQDRQANKLGINSKSITDQQKYQNNQFLHSNLRKRENDSNLYIDSQQFDMDNIQYYKNNFNKPIGNSQQSQQSTQKNRNYHREYFEEEQEQEDEDEEGEDNFEEEVQEGIEDYQSNQMCEYYSDEDSNKFVNGQINCSADQNQLNFKCSLGKNYTYNITLDKESLMQNEDFCQEEDLNEQNEYSEDQSDHENENCEEEDIEQEEKEIQEDENSYEESDESDDYYENDQNEEMLYGINIPPIPPLPDDLEFAYNLQEQQIYEEYEPNDQSFSENNGLTKAEIMSLPTIVYTTQSLRTKIVKLFSSQQDCSICLNNYIDKEILRVLPCEHRFHRACIDKWLLQNSRCVICKFDLLSNQNQDS